MPPGQAALGFLYGRGRGVERNATEAVRWYRRAAEQGNARAQNNLGVMYGTGRGVERNDAEAVRSYRRAAEQGDAVGQTNLGAMYRGRDVRERSWRAPESGRRRSLRPARRDPRPRLQHSSSVRRYQQLALSRATNGGNYHHVISLGVKVHVQAGIEA